MEYLLELLLDSKNKSFLNVFRIISTEDRWYSAKEVGNNLGLSERTIQRQFNALFDFTNDYLEENRNDFNLLFKKNRGLYLNLIKGNVYTTFTNKLFNSDETIKILKLILLGKFPSTIQYANDNFLSINYVRGAISRINELLLQFGITYSTTSKELEGDESQIRMLMYSFFWFISKSKEWPEEFYMIDKNKIEMVIDKFIERLGLHPSYLVQKELKFIFAVSILRIHQNHQVKFRKEWRTYVSYGLHSNLIEAVQEMFEVFSIYDEFEVLMMVLTYIMRTFLYESKKLTHIIIEGNIENESDVYEATKQFMNLFSNKIINIPENKYTNLFIEAFKVHLFSKIYRSISFDYNANSFNESLVKQFPEIANSISDLVNELYQKTNDSLFEAKNYLIQQYLIIFMDIVPLTYFEKKIRISIETDLPELLENIIRRYIKDSFIYKYNISFVYSSFIQKPDIILTNMINEMSDGTVIGFHYPINNRTLTAVETAIEKLIVEK